MARVKGTPATRRRESPTMVAAKKAFKATRLDPTIWGQKNEEAPKHPYLREYLTGRDRGWDYRVSFDMRGVMLVARSARAHTHNLNDPPIPEGIEVQLKGQTNAMTLKVDYDKFMADWRAVMDGKVP